ncbi:hypothetical protein NNJEOMEG_03156 [Fundidesulfovibrio magnetotacticus]|uniref:Co-chaperone DjlA N-terminal domain-containing protein n=1 Tax=Fundidesulfovibrio magnetotacticus TaxID=2730080 RepID=A0A6V8M0B7_9BACT|nr:tellurite resistance TerB family protein [Fundidesulfovibrio magnetotacticus]GFK95297.1 hypothetical protein NNJEOMEG_03156 [Fundidesulfovibrio magnetotacticus]
MLDKFVAWAKDTAGTLATQVRKYRNRDFLEAAIAGCAMVAAADGVIAPEEKRKMMGFISHNDALKHFDAAEAIALFEKYAGHFQFDPLIGKGECLKAIAPLRKRPEEARLMVLVCCAIGTADGCFDANEKQAVREICAALEQNPKDFNL